VEESVRSCKPGKDAVLTLANADVVSTEGAQWREALGRVRHDIYHTPEYHCLSGFGQQGKPQAFVYQEDALSFFWPYLLSPIAGAAGFHDATSVYGYSGPVGSTKPDFAARAWAALLDHWKSLQVVSAFTRFHPLLANFEILDEIPSAKAGIQEYGNTVSIDLHLPSEVHVQQYSKNLRYDIRKGRETGLATIEDETWTHTDDFVAVYGDTMARCGSRPEYVVDRAWVCNFREALGSRARLFVTKRGESVAAVMIAIAYEEFLHCHLIGSAPEFATSSPSKILLDDVRAWGVQNGYGSMHLGGGLGGREDALFQFKRRFSPLTHSFRTGRWILDEPVYRDLEEANRSRLAAKGIRLEDVSYFPSYRFNPSIVAG
jgi:hypothetical protein